MTNTATTTLPTCPCGATANLTAISAHDALPGHVECPACTARWNLRSRNILIIPVDSGEVEHACTLGEFLADNRETFTCAEEIACEDSLASTGAWACDSGQSMNRIEFVVKGGVYRIADYATADERAAVESAIARAS